MAPTKVRKQGATPTPKPRDAEDPTDTPQKRSGQRRSTNRLLAAGFHVGESEAAANESGEQPKSPASPSASELASDPKVLQVKATLKDGLSRVLQVSTENFGESAAAAFGVLKRGVSQSSELPDNMANEVLAELDDKEVVLEFLCRVAREKRMYSKQVRLTLDMLLKCAAWQDTWEQREDLVAQLPDNLRNCYTSQKEEELVKRPPSGETNAKLESPRTAASSKDVYTSPATEAKAGEAAPVEELSSAGEELSSPDRAATAALVPREPDRVAQSSNTLFLRLVLTEWRGATPKPLQCRLRLALEAAHADGSLASAAATLASQAKPTTCLETPPSLPDTLATPKPLQCRLRLALEAAQVDGSLAAAAATIASQAKPKSTSSMDKADEAAEDKFDNSVSTPNVTEDRIQGHTLGDEGLAGAGSSSVDVVVLRPSLRKRDKVKLFFGRALNCLSFE